MFIFKSVSVPDRYVGGRYCHQTSSLFTIITKHIHHRQTTKKEKARQKRTVITWTYTEEKNQAFIEEIKMIYTKEHIYKKKKKKKKPDIHNNNKLRNLDTGIHPAQTHMIAEPFD